MMWFQVIAGKGLQGILVGRHCPAASSQISHLPGVSPLKLHSDPQVGEQVHYISLTVNDQVYNLDIYYNNQQGWDLEEIDTAFQMDLDSNADPYNVWLDEVNLTAY